jgi:hypothetical protein
MEQFKASVQYNDLTGTSAADKADNISARKWLANKGFIKEDEFVVGISMSVGENHGTHQDPVYVTFLVTELKEGYGILPEMIKDIGEPVELRKIQVDMKLTDFFALFKRFKVSISCSGLLDDLGYISD